VNKTDLIEELTERLGDKRTASLAVESVVDVITRAVAKGQKVGISGFGVFEKADRAARTARNPTTGEAVKLKKTSIPKFRPGQGFKDIVSGAKKVPPPSKTPGRAVTARAGKATLGDAAAPAKASRAAARPAKAAGRAAAAPRAAAKATGQAATKTATTAPARTTAAASAPARKVAATAGRATTRAAAPAAAARPTGTPNRSPLKAPGRSVQAPGRTVAAAPAAAKAGAAKAAPRATKAAR
jgi:DNA-binding protein HU-beta